MRFFKPNLVALLFTASVIGCASSNKQPIIHRGEIMAEGTNTQLSVRAPALGLVSVYDDTSRSLVHSGVVGPGTVVNLNPVTGTISVTDFQSNGTQVVYTAVNKSHRYVMTFIPQARLEGDGGATTRAGIR